MYSERQAWVNSVDPDQRPQNAACDQDLHCLQNIQTDVEEPYKVTLRKQAYSNILKILPPKKKWKLSDKNTDIFHISAQIIDCGYSLEPPRWGGSNEYPQSMVLSRNKKK